MLLMLRFVFNAENRIFELPASYFCLQTVSDSRKENSGRTTLLKQRPTAFSDLDNDTPRVMLKRIIWTRKYLFFFFQGKQGRRTVFWCS